MAVALSPAEAVVDPKEAARYAGPTHLADDRQGSGGRRGGQGFRYADAQRGRVSHSPPSKRIRAVAIPPAWTDVWICPRPDGHIQATGRDARGRKQYRYHARFRE